MTVVAIIITVDDCSPPNHSAIPSLGASLHTTRAVSIGPVHCNITFSRVQGTMNAVPAATVGYDSGDALRGRESEWERERASWIAHEACGAGGGRALGSGPSSATYASAIDCHQLTGLHDSTTCAHKIPWTRLIIVAVGPRGQGRRAQKAALWAHIMTFVFDPNHP